MNIVFIFIIMEFYLSCFILVREFSLCWCNIIYRTTPLLMGIQLVSHPLLSQAELQCKHPSTIVWIYTRYIPGSGICGFRWFVHLGCWWTWLPSPPEWLCQFMLSPSHANHVWGSFFTFFQHIVWINSWLIPILCKKLFIFSLNLYFLWDFSYI